MNLIWRRLTRRQRASNYIYSNWLMRIIEREHTNIYESKKENAVK